MTEDIWAKIATLNPEDQFAVLQSISLQILLEGLDDDRNFIGEDDY